MCLKQTRDNKEPNLNCIFWHFITSSLLQRHISSCFFSWNHENAKDNTVCQAWNSIFTPTRCYKLKTWHCCLLKILMTLDKWRTKEVTGLKTIHCRWTVSESHTDPTQELRDAPKPSADPPAVHRSLIRNGRVAVKKSFLEKGSGRNAWCVL